MTTIIKAKPKLKTKYAMPGEIVRVVTPKLLVRVGYPLCGDDIRGTEPYKTKFDRLHQALVNGVHAACHEVLGDSNWLTGKADQSISYQSDKMAVSILLNEARLGGNERKVYETDADFDMRGEWKVLSRKIVQTGIREPGYYRGGDDDYEPPYLADARSHCVYKLRRTEIPYTYSSITVKVLDRNCQRKLGEEWI
jgi:hypothetical protein